jgi:NAD(P)-dependent dehydrogenase (short-subunit alcohol dehydrogenase family)
MSPLPTVDLQGRVALVLGGADGVGAAIADSLGSAGAEVMVADSDPDELRRVEARLSVATIECDFAAMDPAATPVAATIDRLGRLDVLVCAQGRAPRPQALLDVSFEDYRRERASALDSTFLCVQAAGRAMASGQEGGRMVVVVGTGALASPGGTAAHDAAQAGLRGLVRAVAVELASQRVTVNAIVHGGGGEPEDVARAALWLIDPDNSFVTGSAVVVDGGQTAMLSAPWGEEG